LNQLNQKNKHTLVYSVIVLIFLVGIFIGLNFSKFDSENKIIDKIENNEIQKINSNLNENVDVKNLLSDVMSPFSANSLSTNELVQFALDGINKDRLDHGLSPVKLGANIAAQNHATDMFEYGYFSHWNSMGVKPYVTYSQNGGRNYVQENIAVSWCDGIGCNLDPTKQIEKLEYSMVYEDEESNWGHRDAILNPSATHVNIGLSYDNHNLYYVQHFETNLINWQEFNLSQDGVLTLSGSLPNGYKINSITIFEDPKTKSVSADDLKTKNPYIQRFYDQGKLVGVVVEKPPFLSFYEECASGKIQVLSNEQQNQCIAYETYDLDENPQRLKLSTNISNWLNDDTLKTIYISLSDNDDNIIPASSVTLNFLS
jgi:hypothetical protein